jgi:probable HAF family extracellular repeat protein
LNSAAENKGINQWGHVAGVSETASADPTSPTGRPTFHAFLWRGAMTDLGTLGAKSDSVAFAVNDLDQVAGADVDADALNAVSWLWQAGRKTPLGTLGGSSSVPFSLNDHAQIVGTSAVTGDAAFHAFLWQRSTMTDLGTFPGDVGSEALDINEQGDVVGLSCADNCRPVLWQHGTIVDLNTLLPASSGWQLFDANAVNEHGQIVGGGLHNGEVHAFLMTPVR